MIRKHTLTHGAPLPFEPAGEPVFLDEISDHFEKYLGDPELVVHEDESDAVHIDVHLMRAEPGRPFHVAATSGMSDKQMMSPTGSPDRLELMLGLPAAWPIDRVEHDGMSFAIRLLRHLGRFPHKRGTWLGYGHDVQNGKPYGKHTQLCAALLAPPRLIDLPPLRLRADDDEDRDVRIHFLAVYLLHADELAFKKANDTATLLAEFDAHGVAEIMDLARPSVIRLD